jgi:uncharacterized membrane protein YphA (DoxX/SURF4 family)
MLPPPLQFVLALLRIATGVALLAPGIQKFAWLASPTLDAQLKLWSAAQHNPVVLKYLDFMLPHAAVLARVVVAGELALGAMLILGFLTPLAAALGFLMVANFHFASGAMLSLDYVKGQDGVVFLLIFPVLLLGRAGLSLGVDGVLGKRMGGGGAPGR